MFTKYIIKTISIENRNSKKRIIVGFVVLVAGVALLLNNLGFYNYELKRYLLRWEMIPITLGLIFILSHDHKGPGIVLLAVGSAFYARDFFDLNFNFWQIFWSAFLILIGIMIIFRNRIDPERCEKKNLSADDIIDEVNIFGGGDRTIISQNFMGGKIFAVFGGSNFNLSRAKLAPGKNYIDVLAVFGGMKLIVPEDWKVKINAISIFGGFSDKHRILPSSTVTESDSELIIKGFVIFGGGEIKSY
jgi:predicted membrane protein